MAIDYWLNKLVFDLQGPDGKERWTNHREEVLDEYPLKPEIRKALLETDIATIQPVLNPYLMRFYLLINGYDDQGSIDALGALDKGDAPNKQKETANG